MIDCRKKHYYSCDSGKGWRHHVLHFAGRDAKFYYKQFIESGQVVVKINLDDRIEEEFKRIIRVCNQYSSNELVQHKLLTNLLIDLILSTEKQRKERVPDEVARVCAYIEGHYANELTLELLAKHIHQSKYHLSRTFKAELGMGMAQYINAVRINSAKDLLAYTNMSVAEITL